MHARTVARALMDSRWLSGHHIRLLGQGFTSTVSLRKHLFLLDLPCWGRSFARNVPSDEERGETGVFGGYPTASRLTPIPWGDKPRS